MATYSFDSGGETYSFDSPADLTDAQVAALAPKVIAQYQGAQAAALTTHQGKTGLVNAALSGYGEGIGSMAEGLGQLTGWKGAEAIGKRLQTAASDIYEPSDKRDTGILSNLYSGFGTGYGLEKVANVIGGVAPVLAGTAVAGLAGPAAATAAGIGGWGLMGLTQGRAGNVKEQLKANPGQAVDETAANIGAVGQALVYGALGPLLGVAGGIGKSAFPTIAKALGPTAESLASDVLTGATTKDAAIDALKTSTQNFLSHTVQAAGAGTAMGIGDIAIRRGQAGESLSDSEAQAQYEDALKTGLLAAPFFGAVGARGQRVAQEHTIEQADRVYQVKQAADAAAAADAYRNSPEGIAEQAANLQTAQTQLNDMLAVPKDSIGKDSRKGWKQGIQELQQQIVDLGGAPVEPVAAEGKKKKQYDGSPEDILAAHQADQAAAEKKIATDIASSIATTRAIPTKKGLGQVQAELDLLAPTEPEPFTLGTGTANRIALDEDVQPIMEKHTDGTYKPKMLPVENVAHPELFPEVHDARAQAEADLATQAATAAASGSDVDAKGRRKLSPAEVGVHAQLSYQGEPKPLQPPETIDQLVTLLGGHSQEKSPQAVDDTIARFVKQTLEPKLPSLDTVQAELDAMRKDTKPFDPDKFTQLTMLKNQIEAQPKPVEVQDHTDAQQLAMDNLRGLLEEAKKGTGFKTLSLPIEDRIGDTVHDYTKAVLDEYDARAENPNPDARNRLELQTRKNLSDFVDRQLQPDAPAESPLAPEHVENIQKATVLGTKLKEALDAASEQHAREQVGEAKTGENSQTRADGTWGVYHQGYISNAASIAHELAAHAKSAEYAAARAAEAKDPTYKLGLKLQAYKEKAIDASKAPVVKEESPTPTENAPYKAPFDLAPQTNKTAAPPEIGAGLTRAATILEAHRDAAFDSVQKILSTRGISNELRAAAQQAKRLLVEDRGAMSSRSTHIITDEQGRQSAHDKYTLGLMDAVNAQAKALETNQPWKLGQRGEGEHYLGDIQEAVKATRTAVNEAGNAQGDLFTNKTKTTLGTAAAGAAKKKFGPTVKEAGAGIASIKAAHEAAAKEWDRATEAANKQIVEINKQRALMEAEFNRAKSIIESERNKLKTTTPRRIELLEELRALEADAASKRDKFNTEEIAARMKLPDAPETAAAIKAEEAFHATHAAAEQVVASAPKGSRRIEGALRNEGATTLAKEKRAEASVKAAAAAEQRAQAQRDRFAAQVAAEEKKKEQTGVKRETIATNARNKDTGEPLSRVVTRKVEQKLPKTPEQLRAEATDVARQTQERKQRQAEAKLLGVDPEAIKEREARIKELEDDVAAYRDLGEDYMSKEDFKDAEAELRGLKGEDYAHRTLERRGDAALPRDIGEPKKTPDVQNLTPTPSMKNKTEVAKKSDKIETGNQTTTILRQAKEMSKDVPKPFLKEVNVEYDAGSGNKTSDAATALKELKKSMQDHLDFLKCLEG